MAELTFPGAEGDKLQAGRGEHEGVHTELASGQWDVLVWCSAGRSRLEVEIQESSAQRRQAG